MYEREIEKSPYKMYERSEAHVFRMGALRVEEIPIQVLEGGAHHTFCMEAHMFCMESGSKSGNSWFAQVILAQPYYIFYRTL